MNKIVAILMARDNISKEEATEIVADCRQRIYDGENPEDVLYELGLEPDYVFYII